MKIIYGVLNWKRDPESTLKSIKGDNIILCSDKDIHYDNVYLIKGDPNVAKSRNNIIDKARELNGDYLVMIDDDIIISNMEIIDSYISKLKEYDLGVIFYGYGSNINKALSKPNPLFSIKVGEGKNEIFNRLPSSSLFVIDLNKNKLKFDEDLIILEFDAYIANCFKEKLIPFNGFYFDVENSYNYITTISHEPLRVKTQEIVNIDKNILNSKGVVLQLDSNADPVVRYLKEKHKLN